MLKTFEPPRLEVVSGHPANPFAEQVHREPVTEIDGVSVSELTSTYGSPLFVFSEEEIRNNLHRWKQAFTTMIPHVKFSWSYKTNYLRGICQTFHDQGSLAEVVSEMEYTKARALGVSGSDIVVNGPDKSPAFLRKAFTEGARVHIDHFDELDDVLEIADEAPAPISVGIRVNLDAGIHPVWSRFGFNLESGEARQALRQLLRHPNIRLSGLHCHLGTYILEPLAYGVMVRKLLELAYWAEDQFGQRIETLDLGGGFPSPARLKGLYQAPDVYLPKPEAYATAVADALQAHLRPGHQPMILLETGRALIDSAGTLLTSVRARKTQPDGSDLCVMDAGVNLLYTATWYEMQAALTRERTEDVRPTRLVGPLCMNIDVLHERWMLPPLERGETLAIPNVGAYNVTQSMQFIHCRPAVVMVRTDGTVDVLRQAERLEDLEVGEPT